MDINQIIAHRLRELRSARGMTLAVLAEHSGVSRSNISLIERGESSATATVLDKLAAALGVPVASLFERPVDATSPIARADEQPVWTDPGSGYVRRTLSPTVPSLIQMVEITFPAGARVAYETSSQDIDRQLWMIEGRMEITVGTSCWDLAAGDCLVMRLDEPSTYHNPGTIPARYLIAQVMQAAIVPRAVVDRQ
ncbi:XRE family transcriptional regulator [Pseudoduganella sp. SL102]|uniref:helix-turn-helix domain-containing protein n=1 Tax=Pseudoduganella sp. SL102 TaxID=2995154 RepID=UPI00248B00AC|nr:XRE family transcriptional regulator [Pseudoduganella sp. SL102]WBS03029.1 XRE family transcriptional regulator [Pseudoduganella sp. SL102]